MIFIEEPEVHLHSQVQQTFISNISEILKQQATDSNDIPKIVPQLFVTTHSAHILDTVEFSKVRYFRRCHTEGDNQAEVTTSNLSEVLNLRNFQPEATETNGHMISEEDTLTFLQKYLRLTHCSLFFADAAILVEGAVEKLLLPQMIKQSAPGLLQRYVTILEVGGAYAHRFSGLLKFLKIPYLVITDLDSVEHETRKVCCADTEGAQTSNASLKHFFEVTCIAKLREFSVDQRTQTVENRFIAFQTPVKDGSEEMLGRTFEETFIYENLEMFRAEKIPLGIEIPQSCPTETYKAVYQYVKSGSLKKTDFALTLLDSSEKWIVPKYISDGLYWLKSQLDIENGG